MALGYNVFPLATNYRNSWFAYEGMNWGGVFGLHYAGFSKVPMGTTLEECNAWTAKGDSTPCCIKWVRAEAETRALLDTAPADMQAKWDASRAQAAAQQPAGGATTAEVKGVRYEWHPQPLKHPSDEGRE